MLENFKKIFGFAYAQSLIGFRNLYPLISVGLIPGALYLMFYLVGGKDLSQHVLYGALIAQAIGAGMVSLPQFIVIHRTTKLKEMYIASPMGPMSYMTGFALGRLIYMLPGTTVLLVLMLGLGFMQPENILLTLIIVLITFMLGNMIGFTISSYIQSPFATGAISNILNSLLMMLPPVLYPLAVIPAKYQLIAFIAPTTVVAELLRFVNNLTVMSSGRLLFSWLLLGFWLCLCTLFVVFKSRWREV